MPRNWRNFVANPVREAASPKTGPEQSTAIPEGNRNNELTRIAGQMRRAGLTEPDILDVLSAANKRRCNPPLNQAQLTRSLAMSPNIPLATLCNWPILASNWRRRCWTVISAVARIRHEKDGQFWRWNGKHWEAIDDRFLQRLILDTAKTLPTKAHTRALVHEAFALLGMLQSSEDDLLHINDDPPPVINLRNG